MSTADTSQVRLALLTRGHLSAAELAVRVGVSQPTISRAIAQLGPSVLRIGRGRSTRYALRRPIAQFGDRWPLYEIGPDGEASHLGNLTAIYGGGFHLGLNAPDGVLLHGGHGNGLFPGLPWFIQDMRPRGFMGRAFARMSENVLHLPGSPERWTSDEMLIAMLAFGVDLPGAYVLGRENIDAFLGSRTAATPAIPDLSRADAYPRLAELASSGGVPGSSAGGEQPKFTASVRNNDGLRQVIVKFSGQRSNPVASRWADLLVAEHLASATLAQAGIPSATSAIVEAAGRSFLEVSRFDRVGEWGRLPVATLEALDAGLVGSGAANWGDAIPALVEAGIISPEDASWLETAFQFGHLIGNDDMHLGNLAFRLTPGFPLPPAPIYDMLPMHYRPRAGGDLPEGPVRVPPARPEQRDARQRALPLARQFWRQLADDPSVSEGFRRIAVANASSIGS
jgi:hypothetical protein